MRRFIDEVLGMQRAWQRRSLLYAQDAARLPGQSRHGGARASGHRLARAATSTGLKPKRFSHPRRRHPAEDLYLRRRQQAARAGAGGRIDASRLNAEGSDAAARHGPVGRLRRHQRVRPLRHQQLHVPRICLRLGRDRRFRARPGPRRFGGRLHLQPQSVPRGLLTRDRDDAIPGLRKAVAGDDSALYNALLLTLRDAAKVPGRKVVIVFSNGPDNASMVAPDDVRAVAEDEGIPIYVISTNEVNKDPISSGVFRRISTAPAARPTSPRPGRSRWKRSKTSAKISATRTRSPTTRSRTRTRASARSRSRSRPTSARSIAFAPGRVTGLAADSSHPANRT